MTDISKALRNKRFDLKDETGVKLLVESPLNQVLEFNLVNCSLHGLGVVSKVSLQLEAVGVSIGDIFPTAKLVWTNEGISEEVSLGRVVLRSFKSDQTGTQIGFSIIDTTMPLNGRLSMHLVAPLYDSKTPYDYELSSDKFSVANFVESSHSNIDLFAKCYQFSHFLSDWTKTNKYAYHNVRTSSMGTRINLNRKRKNNRNDYLIFGSNDYLGLAAHPEVLQAAKDAIDNYGFGSTGSSVTTGITDLHDNLCETLAKTFRKESAILYNSGFLSNIGIINGITTVNDFVVSDIISHASIQDAMQMSKATCRYYKHNNVEHLEKVLKENRSNYSGGLIITEGIFSMDGDSAPLNEIHKLAKKYNARLMVDEAHSFGVLGKHGLGACEKYGILSDVDILMGSFSKICGGIGGFVVGSKELIDWLHHFSRPYIFSVSLAPAAVAAAQKALEIFNSTPQLVDNLKNRIEQFSEGIRTLGFKLPEKHESSVVPVIIGDEKKLGQMYEILIESGVYVVPIIYPAVSRKNCRFRFTLMATHSVADIDFALNVLERAMEKVGFDPSQMDGAYYDIKKVA